jgi:general secretion pathway protein D
VKVSFARSSNALIVVADEEDFRRVRGIVRELDVQRPQVYVEAVILETSLTRSQRLGVSFHGVGASEDGSGLVAFSPGGESSLVTDAGSAKGLFQDLAVGLFGPEMEVLGLTIPSLGAIFRVAAGNTDVNVLSMPQLIATDHEKASIKVGRNIAIKTTSTQAVGGAVTTSEGFSRENVDLSLGIEPSIGTNGDVTLKIDLSIRELDGSQVSGQVAWTTRELSTVVSVRDGQPIVLGGLISDIDRVEKSKIPFLGDLPVLGVLFRSSSTSKEKRSLMILLVPTVLPDARSARALYAHKLRERQEFARTMEYLETGARLDVDLTRKRGLVAEIDVQVKRLDEDSDLRVAPPVVSPAPAELD